MCEVILMRGSRELLEGLNSDTVVLFQDEGEIESDFLLKECSPTACFHRVMEASRNPPKAERESTVIRLDTQAAGPDGPLALSSVDPFHALCRGALSPQASPRGCCLPCVCTEGLIWIRRRSQRFTCV